MSAWGRRAASVLACAALGLSPLLGATPARAQTGPPSPIGPGSPSSTATAGPTTSTPIAVTLTSLLPIAPQPGDTLVLEGTVTNTSDAAISGLAEQLRMSGPVGARSTFDEYADDPGGSVSDLSGVLTTVAPLAQATLGPGASEPFRIDATLDPASTGLPTSSWEVRELGIDITGLTAAGSGSVGSLRTFLPWAPHEAVGPQRLQVAWLWPLVDQPHRAASATWLNDDLAPEVAPGGRLANLLTAAATAANQAPPPQPLGRGGPTRHGRKPNPYEATDVPVTWAIDPMLIDDVNAMRNGYQVADTKHATAGKGSTDAKSWLMALRDATIDNAVIPLPYGAPDVVAAVRNGLATLVGVASTAGRRVLGEVLPSATLLDTAWPPGGLVDQHAVDALFSDGATSLVLADSALPPVVAPNQTPSSRASLVTAAGDIPTALFDSILSSAVSQGADSGADPVVDLQRYLAETLMIEAEAPSNQRSILIAPSPRWQPSPSYAAALLADTGKVPWLAPTTLSAILGSAPDSTIERSPLDYPSAARTAELPASYLRQVSLLQHDLSELTNILPPGDTETQPLSAGLLRALSTAWRGVPAQRRAWLDEYARSLDSMTSSVHIVSVQGSTVTLTGHGGKVPVTIANNLSAPARITVQLDANQRLTLPGNGQVAVTIPANQQTTVDVHAAAKTSGVFSLEVQLLTPDGQKYGTPVQLFVRSTVYGTITLVITGVATAALLVAVGIRLTRRAINARRAANSAAS